MTWMDEAARVISIQMNNLRDASEQTRELVIIAHLAKLCPFRPDVKYWEAPKIDGVNFKMEEDVQTLQRMCYTTCQRYSAAKLKLGEQRRESTAKNNGWRQWLRMVFLIGKSSEDVATYSDDDLRTAAARQCDLEADTYRKRIDVLTALLREAQREHKFILVAAQGRLNRSAVEGCTKAFYPEDKCTCGADDWNARVDAVLKGATS